MNTSKSLLSVLMAFVLLFSSCASTKQTTTQPDLSTKAWPSVVRVLDALPRTATNKVLKRSLRDLPPELGETWIR